MIDHHCRERRLLGFSPAGPEISVTPSPGERDHKQELIDGLAGEDVSVAAWSKVLEVLDGKSGDCNKVQQAREKILATARELNIDLQNLPNLYDPAVMKALIYQVRASHREWKGREESARLKRENVTPQWREELNEKTNELFSQKSVGSGDQTHMEYRLYDAATKTWVALKGENGPQEWKKLRDEYRKSWHQTNTDDPLTSYISRDEEKYAAFITKFDDAVAKNRA